MVIMGESYGKQFRPDKLLVSHERPRVSVGFFTETVGLLVANDQGITAVKANRTGINKAYSVGDATRSADAVLKAVRTQKSISNVVGTFEIEIVEQGRYKHKFGFGWEHILRPNTLIWIDMQRDGLPAVKQEYEPSEVYLTEREASEPRRVMVGFVDSLTYSASMTGGKPQRTITIRGKDVGKILINAQIQNALAVNIAAGAFSSLDLSLKQIEPGLNVVASLIKQYFQNKLFGKESDIGQAAIKGHGLVNFELGPADKGGRGALRAKDVLKFEASTPNDAIMATPSMVELTFDGNYMNLFKKMCGVPFNEIFVDTRTSSEISRGAVIQKVDRGDSKFFKSNVQGAFVKQQQVNPTVGLDSGVGVSDLFPNGSDVFGTMFVRPCPWPWRGDDFVNRAYSTKDNPIPTIFTKTFDTKFNVDAPDNKGMRRWQSLPTHIINDEDIVSYTRHRTDDDVYNWFWVQDRFWYYLEQASGVGAGVTQAAQYVFNPPILYQELIKRYGIKFVECTVPFVIFDRDDSEKTVKNAFRYTRRLADWYAFNFIFWSGSITVKGNPNVHIGDKCHVLIDGREYYIEGVSQDFQVFGQWTTTLQLSRGTQIGFWGGNDANLPQLRFFQFDSSAGAVAADAEWQEKRLAALGDNDLGGAGAAGLNFDQANGLA